MVAIARCVSMHSPAWVLPDMPPIQAYGCVKVGAIRKRLPAKLAARAARACSCGWYANRFTCWDVDMDACNGSPLCCRLCHRAVLQTTLASFQSDAAAINAPLRWRGWRTCLLCCFHCVTRCCRQAVELQRHSHTRLSEVDGS